jgi:hypothetical protein
MVEGMSRAMRGLWAAVLAVGLQPATHASEDLFASDSILNIELRGPLAATVRDTRHPTERPFEVAAGEGHWPVDVRARGKSRVHYCRFPPLRLDFDTDTVNTGPFAGQDKLKLVTHCGDGAQSDDNLLEEYVAYRIFAALSPLSHRVRLLRLTYVDTDKPDRAPVVKHAFAIEPVEQVAERNEGSVAQVEHLVTSRIDREQAALMFVFQYLIANVDWSLVKLKVDDECCHNVHVLTRDERDFLVPYDFDLSGLVNARYARRAPKLRNRSVRDRTYEGYCLGGLELERAVAAIVARKPEIMAIIQDLPWSDAEEAIERHAFLAAFFEEAATVPLAGQLADKCVG